MTQVTLHCRNDLVVEPSVKRMLAELGTHRYVRQMVGMDFAFHVYFDYAPILKEILSHFKEDSFHNQLMGLRFDYQKRKVFIKRCSKLVSFTENEPVQMATRSKDAGLLLHYDTATKRVVICDDGLLFDIDPDHIESFEVDLFDVPVRIVCAANRLVMASGDRIVVGARHNDIYMREAKAADGLTNASRGGVEFEGFIDQRGNFYTRTQAWLIAEVNGQILRRCGGDTTDGGTLYSENLY